jgi:hypothetical protein
MTTSLKMTNKARSAARSLAIRYNAFNDASENGDSEMITLWGKLLIESQEEVGVEMYEPDLIRARSDD